MKSASQTLDDVFYLFLFPPTLSFCFTSLSSANKQDASDTAYARFLLQILDVRCERKQELMLKRLIRHSNARCVSYSSSSLYLRYRRTFFIWEEIHRCVCTDERLRLGARRQKSVGLLITYRLAFEIFIRQCSCEGRRSSTVPEGIAVRISTRTCG